MAQIATAMPLPAMVKLCTPRRGMGSGKAPKRSR